MIKLTLTTTRMFEDRETFAEYVAWYRMQCPGVPQSYFRDMLHRGHAEYSTADSGCVGLTITTAKLEEIKKIVHG